MNLKRFVFAVVIAASMLSGCSSDIFGDDDDLFNEGEELQQPAGQTSGDSQDAQSADSQDAGNAVQVLTKEGRCTITFFGPFEARRGDPFVVEFQVVCGEAPGQGIFYATLGVPPSDANATHANGDLGLDGRITLTLDVNWETGATSLLCSYEGEVYEVTEITILESG
jgi:hypothetical protein